MKEMLNTKLPGPILERRQRFSVRREATKNADKEKLDFEKRVRIDVQHMSLPELNKVENRCQKLQKILSKSEYDLRFNIQREHQVKLKPDGNFFVGLIVS